MPKSARVLTLADGRVMPVVRCHFIRAIYANYFAKGASPKPWSWA